MKKPSGQVRVGIGGWVYAPWRDNFYPPGLVQRRELEYASGRVSAIEVNGTYYGMQKPATYARWAEQTPAGFLFSAKAPKRITGARDLAATGAQIEDFITGIAELGEKLGPLVWQFEQGSHIDPDRFAAFLALLPDTCRGLALRHVLDVRDPAFVNPHYLALARRRGVATVFTDSKEHPSFADVTSDFVYARLMRSRADLSTGYPSDELDTWARRAREWSGGDDPADLPHLETRAAPQRPRDVFIFFIAAAKERNPAAALALLDALGSGKGGR